MTTTKHYPDSLTPAALALLDAQVSVEIALGEPTSGLLDGSARERRNRRILARALAGITPKYGSVSVAQAAAELEDAERMVGPVAVATALPSPVFGWSKGKGRKARRNAARRAAAAVKRVA
ncbi:hypothetical protein JOF41_006450 [Saccharothrix coeruleofusca]|uniref:hypothetical protein n=1 Tax=Saccharothrix coeruleofusca TaxID=33919 RepID=UPI001AE65749|nr:hypothetical protein [Saccharothrix coeruleofusca]MBP2340272.1 hypothetical protein [Saccharothrix coeruleofusca]